MMQLIEQNREQKMMERQQMDRAREVAKRVVEDEGEKGDCESILSTYSTLYNHPKLISEPKKLDKIRICPKTGIPKEVLGKGLTAAALKRLDIDTGVVREDDLATVRSHIS